MDDEVPDTTFTLEPLKDASAQDWLGSNQDPDVFLSVPNLGIDRIKLVVDNLQAHVRLNAQVLDLVRLDVGADVSIDKVDLEIDNVRAQAMLKVKLERVAEIIKYVVDLLSAQPDILTNLVHGTPEHARVRHDDEEPTQLEGFSRDDLQAIAQAMWREDLDENEVVAEIREIRAKQEDPKDNHNQGGNS